MQDATQAIKSFLEFVCLQFISHPQKAELRIQENPPNKLHFRLILDKSDVPLLIGRNGFTASALRSLTQAIALKHKVSARLLIHSHEEEHLRMAALEHKIIEE